MNLIDILDIFTFGVVTFSGGLMRPGCLSEVFDIINFSDEGPWGIQLLKDTALKYCRRTYLMKKCDGSQYVLSIQISIPDPPSR